MASDLSRQKLSEGLKRLDEIELEIEEEAAAAQAALALATANLAQIKKKQAAVTERRTSMTTFLSASRSSRRKDSQTERLLLPVAGYDLSFPSNDVSAPPARDTSPAPAVKKGKTKAKPAPLPPRPSKRKGKEEPAASSPPPSKRPKTTQETLENCPLIIKNGMGGWVELRCPVCHGNTEPQKGQFYKGLAGLQKHLQTNHEEKLARAEVIRRCWYRTVPDAEAGMIERGEMEVEKVRGGKVTGGGKGKGGGGEGKSLATVPEEEEEAEVVEEEAEGEDGGLAEKEEGGEEEVEEVEEVRPSDSVPATEELRDRMAQFREEMKILVPY